MISIPIPVPVPLLTQNLSVPKICMAQHLLSDYIYIYVYIYIYI